MVKVHTGQSVPEGSHFPARRQCHPSSSRAWECTGPLVVTAMDMGMANAHNVERAEAKDTEHPKWNISCPKCQQLFMEEHVSRKI